MTEQEMYRLNEKLDRIEAQVDNMNRTLDTIVAEIEKYKQPKVFEYDGEIMYRYKENKNK